MQIRKISFFAQKNNTDNKQIVYNSVCLSFFLRATAQCEYILTGSFGGDFHLASFTSSVDGSTAFCLEN
ncbi:hypothetical protein T07_11225 [Trichinella nelsoni]|uniref:Uncharacterized protein n=1 Tax=Trichinella nelsoni TaxID=6336 RepID=A0A0V0SDD1_9BILA|nr:hypothetical protein T07_11225 [Trichinella nelsoni]